MSLHQGRERIRALRELMAERGIDALLVTRRENVRYLTGFTGSAGSVLLAAGKPCLVTDFRYKLQARIETSGLSVVVMKNNWAAAVKDAAAARGAATLWIDGAAMTVDRVAALRKQGIKTRAAKDPVGELRQRKDRTELGAIRKAIRRAEESFEELRRRIRPGVRERELGLMLEFLMREKGSRSAAFDTIVASGGNGAMPHAATSDKKLRQGELVVVDFGAEADGYFCDLTRTLCIGKPTVRQREIHGLVLRAQQEAIRAAVPGTACSAIDGAARSVISRAGKGKLFGHATGHGVGLMVHEGPSLSSLSKDVAAPGMVFTVEPGVYVPGWGGVRIEDMVLVTESGAETLTSLPREL